MRNGGISAIVALVLTGAFAGGFVHPLSPAAVNAQTAVGYALPQLVVAAFVETVVLPGYSGTIFSAAERLTRECPQMFSRATMQQITCSQFIAFVKSQQFMTSFLIGGRGEYTFVTSEYAPDRKSAIVVVQITRRNSRGQVERQYAQSYSTVLEDGALRVQLEDRIIAAVKGASPAVAAAPTPPDQVRIVALSARASAGSISVTVTNAEFGREATILTVGIENGAEVEANLFSAIANATLKDDSARTYAIRMLKSDLPDRVPPRSTVRGRLVFEPLSMAPSTKSAMLILPGIRVADAVYDVNLELRF